MQSANSTRAGCASGSPARDGTRERGAFPDACMQTWRRGRDLCEVPGEAAGPRGRARGWRDGRRRVFNVGVGRVMRRFALPRW